MTFISETKEWTSPTCLANSVTQAFTI